MPIERGTVFSTSAKKRLKSAKNAVFFLLHANGEAKAPRLPAPSPWLRYLFQVFNLLFKIFAIVKIHDNIFYTT